MRVAEGKETKRGEHRMVFTKAEEKEMAERIKAEKGEGVMLDHTYIVETALKLYREHHPNALRSSTPFVCSPHWITRFKRRNRLNNSKHYVRQLRPADPAERDNQHEVVAHYQLQLADAIDHVGAEYVVNADEMFAKHVEHPTHSVGLVGVQNIVRSDLNKKNGITTTPFVSAAGDKVGMQVIAKGTTQRCVDNRHLPLEIAAHFSASGWQTEDTFIRAIDDVLIPHYGPEGGALVVDKYSAHLTDKVRMHCNENNIDLIEVPAHMTHALQPLDIGVNAQLRNKASKKYVKEQRENKENRDPLGAAATRMHDALNALDNKHITRSFQAAADYVPEL